MPGRPAAGSGSVLMKHTMGPAYRCQEAAVRKRELYSVLFLCVSLLFLLAVIPMTLQDHREYCMLCRLHMNWSMWVPTAENCQWPHDILSRYFGTDTICIAILTILYVLRVDTVILLQFDVLNILLTICLLQRVEKAMSKQVINHGNKMCKNNPTK